ncbi:RNA polymerase sigma factor [Pseudomonas sp. GX19020]|nr:RNA polymerase sigma factor [Pseudomonas sp. GX19020]MCL4069165.1 RNA polymerase sigma factor [Pseudomonas sp. GX19020]
MAAAEKNAPRLQGLPAGLRLISTMLMDTPDETLASAAAEGDRAAFATLVARHYDRIFGLAWRLSGNRSDAEDLAQDICAALPVKLRNWRSEARFTTWLYRVVVNAAHDQRRRQATRSKAAEGWGDWELARQDEIETGREAEIWLHQAMAQLSSELRDTVALVLGEEMTQAQAGEVLGVTEGTISWRMSEVKKRLRVIAAREVGK